MTSGKLFFTPDGTLTEKGEQQVADEISSQVIRGKDGNAIGKEGVKKLDMASARMDDQISKMIEAIVRDDDSGTGEEAK